MPPRFYKYKPQALECLVQKKHSHKIPSRSRKAQIWNPKVTSPTFSPFPTKFSIQSKSKILD